jgi:hypothetical protein
MFAVRLPAPPFTPTPVPRESGKSGLLLANGLPQLGSGESAQVRFRRADVRLQAGSQVMGMTKVMKIIPIAGVNVP